MLQFKVSYTDAPIQSDLMITRRPKRTGKLLPKFSSLVSASWLHSVTNGPSVETLTHLLTAASSLRSHGLTSIEAQGKNICTWSVTICCVYGATKWVLPKMPQIFGQNRKLSQEAERLKRDLTVSDAFRLARWNKLWRLKVARELRFEKFHQLWSTGCVGLYLSNWIGLTFGWKLPIDFRGKALATAAATFEGAMRPSKGLEAGYKSYERVRIDFYVS